MSLGDTHSCCRGYGSRRRRPSVRPLSAVKDTDNNNNSPTTTTAAVFAAHTTLLCRASPIRHLRVVPVLVSMATPVNRTPPSVMAASQPTVLWDGIRLFYLSVSHPVTARGQNTHTYTHAHV